ncbi:MAG: hypothetical protein PF636_00380 [Actinomycetota bacterium]|jgi:hypothetical protein|nr:hypothetical protein [Actinomycetota bacterium]
MSITIVQLVPLAVTFFALALTGPALNPAPTRVRKYFVLLNLSVFMWSFGVFMQFSGGNTVIDPTVMVFGSGAYLWFLLVVTGITATPTAWFFFAVEYAGIRDHMPRWLLRLACAPQVLSITFGVLNPWTQQIARLGQETGLVEYPAIAFAYSLVLAVLSVSGAYMLVRY